MSSIHFFCPVSHPWRFPPLLRATGLLSLLVLTATPAVGDSPTDALKYPPTRTGDVVDDYFGTRVADPYRWLEDLDSTDTAAWIAAQNKVTFAYLESLPQREAIRKRLTELWDYRRTGLPVLEAGQLWFAQNAGLQRQAPIYRQAGFDAKPTLVIDPNLLSPDGSVAMAQWSPSPDGRWLAYSSAAGGSDIEDIHVRDLATGKDLADVVPRVKFSNISWTRDSNGFFYSRFKGTESSADFAATVAFHQVWYHGVRGRKPDRLIFERPENRNEVLQASLSDDGRWLYVTAFSGASGNRLWMADLGTPSNPDLGARPLAMATEEDAIHTPLGVIGGTVYLYTTLRGTEGPDRCGEGRR